MDSADKINLTIITIEEERAWKSKYKYREYWTRYNSAYFLNASQASKGLNVTLYQLEINRDATVSEVIKEARKLLSKFDRSFEKDFEGSWWNKWPVSYSLFYPALGENSLSESDRLSQLGVTDGELMVLERTVHSPPCPASMGLVKDFRDFQRMVLLNGNPKDERNRYCYETKLYATLLYTDEDIKLATFIRKHFDELHKMSGPNLMVYVVEEPPRGSAYTNSTFWKAKVEYTAYLAWSLLGWVRSKPYDKSAAYEIARSLGVYPDQLPCVALFNNVTQPDKIIVPVQDNYSKYFRTLFSNVQRHLDSESVDRRSIDEQIWSSDYEQLSWEEKEERELEIINALHEKLFSKLRTAIEKNIVSEREDRSAFNLDGNIVFINHPTGTLKLDNFQNTANPHKIAFAHREMASSDETVFAHGFIKSPDTETEPSDEMAFAHGFAKASDTEIVSSEKIGPERPLVEEFQASGTQNIEQTPKRAVKLIAFCAMCLIVVFLWWLVLQI